MFTRIQLVVGVFLSVSIGVLFAEETTASEPMKGEFSFSIPQYDFKDTGSRPIIINKQDGIYYGQPDTVLVENNHILVACSRGHGGREKRNPETFVKESLDGGKTWSAFLPTPPSFKTYKNAPCLHKLDTGESSLIVSFPLMRQSISKDKGTTWSELMPMFPEGTPGERGHAPPKSMIKVKSGGYLIMWHDHEKLYQSMSKDGKAWSTPRRVDDARHVPGSFPCEPCIIRSPDGKLLLALVRENNRKYQSLYMTSNDEGKTWTALEELPCSLTGDRHNALYTGDGRLIVVFRDTDLKLRKKGTKNPAGGDFCAWVGTYDDIINGNEGQYRVRLLDHVGRRGDTGYSGLELLDDSTIVATTYVVLDGHGSNSITAAVRFKMKDLDKLAGIKN